MTLKNRKNQTMKIVILNLMPNKEETEKQLMSRLEASFSSIEITLLTTATYESKHACKERMKQLYKTLDQIREDYFDGMIITGAPVETLAFEEVLYWDELRDIMDWAQTHTKSVLHICWGAQAGIYHHYGVKKHALDQKLSGIYQHEIYDTKHPLLQGVSEGFLAPHSRYTTVLEDEVRQIPELTILAGSKETECYIVADKQCKNIFVMGHMEYDCMTLDGEYRRDLAKEGVCPNIPKNYYPNDDSNMQPEFVWLEDSKMFFRNWIHQYLKANREVTEVAIGQREKKACYY